MSPPEPATKPTVDQNPKSILLDRHHSLQHQRDSLEKANDHSNLRVTFAKATINKQSRGNLVAGVNPVTIWGPGQKGEPPTAQKGTVLANTSGMRPVSNPKADPAPPTPKAPKSTTTETRDKGESKPVKRGELEKTLKQNPRSSKAFAAWLSSTGGKPMENKKTLQGTSSVTSSKRSVETVNSEGNDSTGTAKRTHLTKSRKRMRKLAKASNKSVSGTPKRARSGRRLKKSKKKTEEEDKDIEGFKPAPLNTEYATELSKITQIIKAVSATDNVPPSALPGKIEEEVKSQLNGLAMRRPLSGDELKQLLSSITRVVSLHKLDEQNTETGTTSGLPETKPESKAGTTQESKDVTASASGSVRKGKKKKVRKVKLPTYLPANNAKETAKSKSRLTIGNKANNNKSKESVRRSKPRVKNVEREKPNNPKRPYSEGSSASSLLDKDPVQNAVFLRKYYEESTRLANKKSSEELLAAQKEIDEEEESDKSKKKKGKKKRKKSGGTTADASKQTSKRSIPTTAKTSVQSSEQPSSAKAGNKPEGTPTTPIGNTSSKIRPQSSTTTSFHHHHHHRHKSASSKLSKKAGGEKGKTKSKLSTTAVSGSPRPFSPIENIGGGENILNGVKPKGSKSSIDESETLKAIAQSMPDRPVKTPPIQVGPTSANDTPRTTQQFQTVQEMMESNKFSSNAAKMRSIWEKTPYQPMTHARFRDIVSKYADPQVTIALAKYDETKNPLRQAAAKNGTVIPPSYTAGRAPGALLTLPKPWEIKEKLAEEQRQQDKIVKELQPPPKYWTDSVSLSAYNKLNYDFKYNMRQDARRLRKKLREEAIRERPTTPTAHNNTNHVMGSTRAEPDEVVDALKFYKEAMRRNAKMY